MIVYDRKLPGCRPYLLFFSHRYSGRKLKEIEARFNIGESAVSQASRRVSMKTDKSLLKGIKLIEKELNLSRV
jgi:hypothetical protein